MPVRLSSLRTGSVPEFSVYLAVGERRVPVLYCGENLAFPEDVRQRLLERGMVHVYIDKREEKAYRQYLERNLSAILSDPEVESGAKAEMLYYSATGLLEEVMAEPRSGELMKRSRDFVGNTCKFFLKDKSAFRHLLSLTSFDYYTYTHSVNVFVFSVALAERLGVTDPVDLREFGEGALLHDLGKSLIDPEVLRWPGKLSPEQWKEIRKHPALGSEVLMEQGVKSERLLAVVRHHREKLRGGGYPDGLRGHDVPEWARICAIADIFDALTTKRCYKNALGSFPALDLMRREMLADLDPDYFMTFVEMLGHPERE